jgi:hypothetical protein
MRRTIIIYILILFCSSAVFAQNRTINDFTRDKTPSNFNPDLKPVQLIPIEPKTIEEKLDASQLAVYGQVMSLVEENTQGVEIGNRKSVLSNFVANVKVFETFKGGVAGDTIPVVYSESSVKTLPPLVTFMPGEKCILFLISADNGRFTPLTPTIGKEYTSDSLLNQLRTLSGAAEKGKGGIVAMLKAGGSAGEGAVYVTLTFINNTAGDVPVYSGVASMSEIIVAGPDGKRISPKQYSRLTSGAAQTFLLPPGHFIGARINLAPLFDFNAPGTYTVTARIPTPKSGGASRAGDLVSNTVSIVYGKKGP